MSQATKANKAVHIWRRAAKLWQTTLVFIFRCKVVGLNTTWRTGWMWNSPIFVCRCTDSWVRLVLYLLVPLPFWTRQGLWAYRMRPQKELLASPLLPGSQLAAYQFPSRHGAFVQHWNPALADAMHSSQSLEFEQGLFYALLDANGSEPWMALCATCFYVNTIIPERIHFQFFRIIGWVIVGEISFLVPNLQWFSGFFRTYWPRKQGSMQLRSFCMNFANRIFGHI